MTRTVIVGSPDNRRTTFFRAALERFGQPPPLVVPWEEIARAERPLVGLVEPGAWIRLESPGESPAADRALLELGATIEDRTDRGEVLPRALAREVALEHGRIRWPLQHHLGFLAALRKIERARPAHPPHQLTSATEDVAIMFDKRRCHAACLAAGVRVPEALGPIEGYDDLRAKMRASNLHRVFVKLAFGSSASGVVALAVSRRGVVAHTSVELVREGDEIRLYNSLRVRRYDDERDVSAIVDHLAKEGVHVERWYPKAGLHGGTFDLRVVVIAGRARHAIARVGSGPMTNLHLGNRRASREVVIDHLGLDRWRAIEALAEEAARVFLRTLHVGVDVLVHASRPEAVIGEVNAFGDLLPNVLDRGLDTYEAEVEALFGPDARPKGEETKG